MLSNYEIKRKDPLLAFLKLCICAVALFLIGHYMPDWFTQMDEARSAYEEPVIRVIANSNTEKDQQIKQRIVRDIQSIHYIDIENKEVIKQIDNLLNEKYEYMQIEMKIGDNLLPPKWLNQTFYPQTTQKSVAIVIGKGRGDNWFCTMFPKVCGKKDREKVRFKWWEWLKEKWS